MNLLQSAARAETRDTAMLLIMAQLKIENAGVAIATLSDPDVWRYLSYAQRMMEIASWLQAECFEAMEFEQKRSAKVIQFPRNDCQGERVS